jgi:hypothetical protein
MVGAGANNSDANTVLLIPASETIDNINTASGVEVIDSTLTVDLPDLRSHGLVNRSPPNVVLGRGLLDNSLVKRRSASLSTRVGSQGTAGGDSGTGLVDKSILVKGSD